MEPDPHLGAQLALQRYRSLIDRYMAARAREMGLHPTDVSAMSYIHYAAAQGRCITPGELGHCLALSGPATTAVIDRLERFGYVERHQSATDGRRIEIHVALEDKGAAAAAIEPALVGVHEVLQSFSPEQIQTFEVIMTTIANRLELEVAPPRAARRQSPAIPR